MRYLLILAMLAGAVECKASSIPERFFEYTSPYVLPVADVILPWLLMVIIFIAFALFLLFVGVGIYELYRFVIRRFRDAVKGASK